MKRFFSDRASARERQGEGRNSVLPTPAEATASHPLTRQQLAQRQRVMLCHCPQTQTVGEERAAQRDQSERAASIALAKECRMARIAFHEVSKYYRGASKPAVDHVS